MGSRISQASMVRSPLSDLVGAEVYELDSNHLPRLGGFSKPRSKAEALAMDAVRRAAKLSSQPGVGDLLVCCDYRGRWQVWEKRAVKCRVPTAGGGTRAKRTASGKGRIFIT
jgi:hypothetical protein